MKASFNVSNGNFIMKIDFSYLAANASSFVAVIDQ